VAEVTAVGVDGPDSDGFGLEVRQEANEVAPRQCVTKVEVGQPGDPESCDRGISQGVTRIASQTTSDRDRDITGEPPRWPVDLLGIGEAVVVCELTRM